MTKIILITGASTGIGEACARAAVEAGHKVALAARSKEKLAALAEELGDDRAIAIACDVTSFEQQQAMVATTLKKFGRIDVAFANAGIGATAAGTEAGDPQNWRDMVLTNVLGAALTAKATISELKKSQGHLLLTGSRAGRVILKGSIYGATKWAIAGYAQNLREELAGTGVRVTNIAPGMVDTPFFDAAKPDALRPEDVANAFTYAISQPSHVDVGEVLIVPVAPLAK